MGDNNPKVSIITVCYNSAAVLEQAIKSVLAQTYPNIEYLVIDGGSTDATVDIIKQFSDQISYWVSEPDRGISHAWNKGIAKATGDIIGILNADDIYLPETVSVVVQEMQKNPQAGFVFGDVEMVDMDGTPCYRQQGDPEYGKKIRYEMPSIPHPSVFVRHQVYLDCGDFDENCKTAMDYEFLLRVTVKGVQGVYIPKVLTHMRLGGESDNNFVRAYREVRDVSVKFGYSNLMAHSHYYFRCLKGYSRRFIERLGLNKVVQAYRYLSGSRYKY